MPEVLRIYHNPRCSKSRQALELIRNSGAEPEVIDYLNNPPTEVELMELIAMLRMRPEELLRKGESEYRELVQGRGLSDTDIIRTMVAHPRLIERPIVVSNKKAVIGRPPENVLELL